MKKQIIAGISAFLFAAIPVTSAVVFDQIHTSELVAEAALTTSQTRTVQTKLKRWGYYTGKVDGIYGNQTRKAVRLFQQKNGLAVDGVVGPKTAAALGMSIGGARRPTTTFIFLQSACMPKHVENLTRGRWQWQR